MSHNIVTVRIRNGFATCMTAIASAVAVLLAPFACLVNAMPVQRLMLRLVGTTYGSAARFPENEALQRVRGLLLYLALRVPLPDDGFYSTLERVHMVDVRTLFQIAYWSAFISLCVCAACFLRAGRINRARYRSAGRWGCIVVLLFIAVLVAALVLIGFDRLFTLFHETFFANDYWLLPQNSSLIRLFPASYFLGYFVVSLSAGVLLAAALVILLRPVRMGHL